jgi:hypothetical protein
VECRIRIYAVSFQRDTGTGTRRPQWLTLDCQVRSKSRVSSSECGLLKYQPLYLMVEKFDRLHAEGYLSRELGTHDINETPLDLNTIRQRCNAVNMSGKFNFGKNSQLIYLSPRILRFIQKLCSVWTGISKDHVVPSWHSK